MSIFPVPHCGRCRHITPNPASSERCLWTGWELQGKGTVPRKHIHQHPKTRDLQISTCNFHYGQKDKWLEKRTPTLTWIELESARTSLQLQMPMFQLWLRHSVSWQPNFYPDLNHLPSRSHNLFVFLCHWSSKLSMPTAAVLSPCMSWFCHSASLTVLDRFLNPNRISQRAQWGRFSDTTLKYANELSDALWAQAHRGAGSRADARHSTYHTQINLGICNQSSPQKIQDGHVSLLKAKSSVSAIKNSTLDGHPGCTQGLLMSSMK